MTTRKTEHKNIRKIIKTGKTSLSVTIPIEHIKKLNWREKQKVVVNLKGSKIIIQDWSKK